MVTFALPVQFSTFGQRVYTQKPDLNYQSLHSQLYFNTLTTGHYVHFGVSSRLFEKLQLQFPNSEEERFYDIYYDTKDFQLARNSLWLKCRSPEDENLPDTWSLKECIINSIYPESLNIDEWKSSSVISDTYLGYCS